MKALRLGMVATLVSLVSVPALVLTTATPAQAAIDPRISAVVDAMTFTPGQVLMDQVTDYALKGTTGFTSEEILASSGVAALLGSPAEVKAGQKVASRACKTGWGCLGVLAVGVGLLGYATKDEWWPWMTGLLEPGMDEYPLQSHTRAHAHLAGIGYGTLTPQDVINWGVTGQVKIDYNLPGKQQNNQYPAAWDQSYEVGCRHKDTGAERYVTFSPGVITGASTVDRFGQVTRAPCSTSEWLVWFDQLGKGYQLQTWNLSPTPAFDWGRKRDTTPDSAIDVTNTVTCARPDGSTYTISHITPKSEGVVKMPSCPNPDVPTQSEITTTGPNGTDTQSVVNKPAADTAGAEMYPQCTAGCIWTVKVNGRPCYDGVAGCSDWTKRKADARCMYGPYSMPLRYCYWMERKFEYQTVPQTAPNSDGDPLTWDGPRPEWDTSSQPTPTTTTSTGTTSSPAPTTSTSPGTGGDPTTNPSTNPVPSPTPTPSFSSPQPPPTSGPTPPAQCETPYNLGPVQPEAVKMANHVGDMFSLATIGGYRETNDAYGEHSSGLALDFMTYSDTNKGKAIADYLKLNASSLGVRWIIWDQKVWNIDRASEGWRLMADRGSPTANHKDHVHLFMQDLDGQSLSCAGDPIGDGAGGDSCWPSGWGWFNPAEWVLKPIKCAMTWAWVPNSAVMRTNFAKVLVSWETAAPAVWAAELAMTADVMVIPQGTCQGPALTLPAPMDRTIYPANACEGMPATLAEILRTCLGASFVVGGLLAGVRFLATGFSYNGFSSGGGAA